MFIDRRRRTKVNNNPNLLLKYSPGDYANDVAFGRGTAAYQQDNNNRLFSSVGTITKRDNDYPSGVRSTLLEFLRVNILLWSSDFSNAAWTKNVNLTRVDAPSIISGQTASKFTNNGTGSAGVFQTAGVFVASQSDTYYVIVEGVDQPNTHFGIRDFTASVWVCQFGFNWSTFAVTLTSGAGTAGAIPLGNNRYLLWCTGSTGTAGNSRGGYCYPSGVGADSTSGIFHHAQFEEVTDRPSSPIVTGAASVSRSGDVYRIGFLPVPQAMSVYFKFVEIGAVRKASSRLLQISNTLNADPRFVILASGGNYAVEYINVTSTVSSPLVAPNFGDTVEFIGRLYADGSVDSIQSINGGVEVDGTQSAALALPANWSGTNFYIAAGGSPGAAAIESVKVLAGIHSLAEMRAA